MIARYLPRFRPLLLGTALAFLAAFFPIIVPFDTNAAGSWTSLADARISREVYALTLAENGDLYAGGFFYSSPATPTYFSRLARWDGAAWSKLGSGRTNGVNWTVTELLADGNGVYVGGEFGSAYIGEVGYGVDLQGIGRWTGADWQPLMMGSSRGVRGTVHALATSGSDLWVGGQFHDAGTAFSTNAVRWNGQQWIALAKGLGDFESDRVLALAVGPDGTLYAGGTLQPGPNCPARGLARWDGTVWTSIGGGVRGGEVYALTVRDGVLYVGGSFADAGTAVANGIARWDGFQWSGVGGGVSGENNTTVFAIAVTNNHVYVGGRFEFAGGLRSPYVARWDEKIVAPSNRPPVVTIDSPLSDSVQIVPGIIPIRVTAADPDGTVTRVDLFTNGVLLASLSAAPYIWDWLNPAPGLHQVTAVAVDNLGGSAGSTNEVAVYDASGPPPLHVTPADKPAYQMWAPDGEVYSVVESDGIVYLGGVFSKVGRVVPGGAMVDVSGTALDLEYPFADGLVTAIASDGAGGFYIGGNFKSVGGVPRANLARIKADRTVDAGWTPSTVGGVSAMLVSQGVLYLGGEFTTVNGEPRSRLAALEAATGNLLPWAPSANSYALDLAVTNGVVYLAGNFTTVDGQPRQRLAAVDASSGQVLSWKFDASDTVRTLVLGDSKLFVGGAFTTLGGSARLRLAAIDLQSGALAGWNPSANGEVAALGFDNGLVYVGGSFGRLAGVDGGPVGVLDAETGVAQGWRPAVNDRVERLAVLDDTVFISGVFTEVNGTARSRVAAFNKLTGQLTSMNLSPVGPVRTLETVGGRVFVTGQFRLITPVARKNLAALDAVSGRVTDWDPQGSGQVYALAVHGQSLYVGGSYGSLGGQPRSNFGALGLKTGNVSPWDPQIGVVQAMTVGDGTLYVGGDFLQAAGQTRERLAAYDLATGQLLPWNPGANESVRALAFAEDTVFLSGMFTRLGGLARGYAGSVRAGSGEVTGWDPGADGPIVSLSPDPANRLVYAGGAFRNIGGRKRDNFAALDMDTGVATPWTAFVGGTVQAIGLGSKVIYIAGQFERVGGIDRLNLAALNPRLQEPNLLDWHPDPFSSGAGSIIRSLWVTPSRVYIGGRFLNVSGETRQYFAAFDLPARLDSPQLLAGGVFQVQLLGQTASTNVFETSTNLVDWIPISTNVSPNVLRDPNAGGESFRFYRTLKR